MLCKYLCHEDTWDLKSAWPVLQGQAVTEREWPVPAEEISQQRATVPAEGAAAGMGGGIAESGVGPRWGGEEGL